MKLLTLIRHAKSSRKDPDLTDIERPLSGRGTRDAPTMGGRLAAVDPLPDLLVSSSAKRAEATARAIAEAIGYDTGEIALERALYMAEPEEMLQVIRAVDESSQHLALVGHNPGITNLADVLADARIDNVPTCGVVRLRLAIDSWREARYGCGMVIDFDYPKREPASPSR
jgi:phosphohistidine phosphatase